jgi:hypothetical protein
MSTQTIRWPEFMSTQTIQWPDGVTPADIVPVDDAPWDVPKAPAPSERMRDLDFMIGDFRLEYIDFTSKTPTSGIGSWQGRRMLGGHVYEVTWSVTVPQLTSRWIYGWNERDSCFYEVFHDDWGDHGGATSPGWQDGKLTLTGEFPMYGFQPGLVVRSQDIYEVIDENHFVKHEVLQTNENDSWVLADIVHGYRI